MFWWLFLPTTMFKLYFSKAFLCLHKSFSDCILLSRWVWLPRRNMHQQVKADLLFHAPLRPMTHGNLFLTRFENMSLTSNQNKKVKNTLPLFFYLKQNKREY